MKDFNFFEPFLQKKKNRNLKSIYIGLGAFFIFGLMLTIYVVNIFRIKNLENSIAEMQVHINSKELTGAYVEKAQLEEKLKILNDYYNSVSGINDTVKKEDYVNTSLIKNISGVVPESVSFQNMSIANKIITMNGIAGNRVAIGEMEYNLKQLGIFEDIHVSIISGSGADIANTSFNFNLTFKLKEDN